MKLFIYEHITSGALALQELPSSLAHEGDKMLAAVLHDCHSLPNLELSILRDARLAKPEIFDNNSNHNCYSCGSITDFQQAWTEYLANADAVFIIAPETENVLANLQQQAVNNDKTILGCLPSAIAIATNKLDCEQQLNNHHISTPQSCLASDWVLQKFEHPSGYIVKPIDGAGCINTFIFDTLNELEHYLSKHNAQALQNAIIQPYIQGITVSLSLLISRDNIWVLAINSQKINREFNALVFNGCVVNGIDPALFSPSQASQLAQKIQQAIPGLWGFVGIDLILTHNDTIVVDINPRLTTSYIGLQQSLSLNPMELLFSINDDITPELDSALQRKRVSITV